MHSLAGQGQIIGMLAAHEAAVAELYRAYAERFPEHAEFFGGLAAEEVKHARLIARLAENVRSGALRVSPDRFSPQVILASLDDLRERVKEARKGELTLDHALSTCADLEQAMIERKFFEIIEADGPELRTLLQVLEADTRAHGDRVRKAREQSGR